MNKWRKITASVLVAALVLPVFSLIGITEVFAAAPEIPDYTGTADTPHPITNKYELASIGSDRFGKELPLDGNYMQTADIVFTQSDFEKGGDFNSSWIPIGSTDKPFSGTYDGGGYVIKNIYVNTGVGGIFGTGSETAVLRNAANVDGNILGGQASGGLIATGFNLVENCYNTGNVSTIHGSTNQNIYASGLDKCRQVPCMLLFHEA